MPENRVPQPDQTHGGLWCRKEVGRMGIARASGKLNVKCRICSSKEAQEKFHFWLEYET
jgi:hypothetical protein